MHYFTKLKKLKKKMKRKKIIRFQMKIFYILKTIYKILIKVKEINSNYLKIKKN